jgi:hypothetical protein
MSIEQNLPGKPTLTPGQAITQYSVSLNFEGIGQPPSASGEGAVPFGIDLMVTGIGSEVPAAPNASGVTNYTTTTQRGTIVGNKTDTALDTQNNSDKQD